MSEMKLIDLFPPLIQNYTVRIPNIGSFTATSFLITLLFLYTSICFWFVLWCIYLFFILRSSSSSSPVFSLMTFAWFVFHKSLWLRNRQSQVKLPSVNWSQYKIYPNLSIKMVLVSLIIMDRRWISGRWKTRIYFRT